MLTDMGVKFSSVILKLLGDVNGKNIQLNISTAKIKISAHQRIGVCLLTYKYHCPRSTRLQYNTRIGAELGDSPFHEHCRESSDGHRTDHPNM